jgi:hypothetical protein
MGTNRCPYIKGTFRALQWASKGGLWLVCKPCRRYRPLPMAVDIAERQFRRTRFVCKRCGAFGRVTEGDPSVDPDYQGFEMDHGAVEAEQRRVTKPDTPPSMWLPPTDPRLETVMRRGELILATLDDPFGIVLVYGVDGHWVTTHDDRPLERTITRWRDWYGAWAALGL